MCARGMCPRWGAHTVGMLCARHVSASVLLAMMCFATCAAPPITIRDTNASCASRATKTSRARIVAPHRRRPWGEEEAGIGNTPRRSRSDRSNRLHTTNPLSTPTLSDDGFIFNPSSTIFNHLQPIFNHLQPSNHQPSSTILHLQIINHLQPSSTIFNHLQPSSTIKIESIEITSILILILILILIRKFRQLSHPPLPFPPVWVILLGWESLWRGR